MCTCDEHSEMKKVTYIFRLVVAEPFDEVQGTVPTLPASPVTASLVEVTLL